MRVLYVIDSLAPGGAERSLAALAPAYRDRGVELEVATLRERAGVRAELEAAGAVVFEGNDAGGRLGRMRRTLALVRERQPDLVHTTLFEADLAGRVAGRVARVPVVSSLVNEEYGPEHLENPRLDRWKVRAVQVVDAATALLVTRLHAVSEHVADVMARRLRFPRPRIDVVPRGRDPGQLGERSEGRRQRARAALEVPDEALVIVAVGRQDYQKGLDVLLESLRTIRQELPGALLVVAGRTGDQTAALERLVSRLRLENHVQFLGERDDVAELLCAADVFALPSRREGAPGALLEAMALETPLVVSNIPATREVIDKQGALLVPPDDAVSLADAIVTALASPAQSATRAAAARARFLDRYTIQRAADGMVEFYQRALATA